MQTYKLRQIDEVLEKYEAGADFDDINHILDLYAIWSMLRDGEKISSWTEEQFDEYNAISNGFPEKIGRFASQINDKNIVELYKRFSNPDKLDFWRFFAEFKLYGRISENKFAELLFNVPSLRHVLAFRKIVERYDETLSKHILANTCGVELVLNKILRYESNAGEITLPASLTAQNIVDLTDRYIDSEHPHPNFLMLVANSRSNQQFPISDEVRLKAKTKHDEYWEKRKHSFSSFKYGVEVVFRPNAGFGYMASSEENYDKYEYDSNWISDNLDFPTLLNNFIYLFGYCDLHCRSCFVSKQNEIGTIEQFFQTTGKDDYKNSYAFTMKSTSFSLMLCAYIRQLQEHDIALEEIFEWFFKTYLREEFGVEGFVYLAPSAQTTDVEKCILLACAIDGVLKQFSMYQKHGEINRELFEMSSGHIKFSSVTSLISKKYLYAASENLKREQFFLFSNQSFLNYMEKGEATHKSLSELLTLENITKEDCSEFERPQIEWLLSRGSIINDQDGFLRINRERAAFLSDLYHNEVSCYSYLDHGRKLIDELIQSGEIRFEDTLFSIPEQAYLNYILNRSQFSNGLDLRNKYVHGTYSLDVRRQELDYIELLKVMVLIIIKINEEFCLKFSFD